MWNEHVDEVSGLGAHTCMHVRSNNKNNNNKHHVKEVENDEYNAIEILEKQRIVYYLTSTLI